MYDLFFVSFDEFSELFQSKIKDKFPHAKFIVDNDSIESLYTRCAKLSFTKMFWTVDVINRDIDISTDWSFEYQPDIWDQIYIHLWDSGDVKLWPTSIALDNLGKLNELSSKLGAVKIMDQKILIFDKYDIFFVSYEEEDAEKNWINLKNRFHRSKHIHGITGIKSAHRKCAELSSTTMFWTIDGDTIVDPDWNFNYSPPAWDRKYVHLWYSRNPINKLEYGYGAIKLWPKKVVLDHDKNWLDFTTSMSGIKVISKTISTTVFNTSNYSTWKSAFRECVKLCINLDQNPEDVESKFRLDIWTNFKSSEPYADWSNIGGQDAKKWYLKNKENLKMINDFEWLKDEFDRRYIHI